MKYFLTLITLFLSSLYFGQISEFRLNDKEFIEDVENFIKPFDKKLAKDISKEMERVYTTIYSNEQREEIVKFSNKMLEKKIKLKPQFLAYFNSINGFAKSKVFTMDEFTNWFDLLNELIKSKNKRRLSDFLLFTDDFFNRDAIAVSSSVKWKLRKGSYTFSYKKGAFVELKNADIICLAKNDSSVIYNTSGVFNVSTKVFLGEKGSVNWKRVGLPINETYAELASYKVNMKSAGFDADSVLMHTPYLSKPRLGKIREKVLTFTAKEKSRYPLYTSYDQSIELKNIFPNIDYKGEFTLTGLNFKGGSSGKNKASIIINKEGKPFMVIDSRVMDINPKKINAKNSSATIYLNEKETITQSLCDFSYLVSSREAIIAGVSNKAISYPFESSYHQLNMHINKVSWKEGQDSIELGSFQSLGESNATFESQDYFSSKDYNEFTVGQKNLVKQLYDFHLSKDNAIELSAVEFASYSKSLLGEISQYLVKMGNIGLIDYDFTRKRITIKPKLDSYIEARKNSGDHDDIFIKSNIKSTTNGSINLSTLELSLGGIRNFNLSKKKFVRVYPKKGKIVIGKDRKIVFSGVINAGRTEYFGKDIVFDYQKFSLDFKELDSMRIRVYPFEQDSDKKQVRLISKLYNLTGTIIIDDENNKAGKNKDFPHYPMLSVNNSPKIYYNQSEILKGVYESENFYFELDPFEMDSLLTFSNSGINYSGKLYSADIFPPLTQNVGLMKDYTLGFSLDNVNEKIYKGSANYNDKLELSSRGLIGKGKLSFLTSSAYSKKITFFPDSMIAKTGLYTNKTQTLPSVPEVKAENCFIMFQPHKGIWKTTNSDSSMYVFDDKVSKFDGILTLTKDKMIGNGTLTSRRIQVDAKDFVFEQSNLNASSSNFVLKGVGENDPPSLEASDMQMKLDFKKRKGEFVSNSGSSIIEFPINKFTATTDEFDWLMDENIMNFKKVVDTANFQNFDENKNLKPNFVSTLKVHKGLGFFSGLSTYYIDSNALQCKKIPYIVVADSRIIPNKGEFKINKNGELVSLTKATIVSNFTSKYHQFTNAEVEIISSEKYYGNGNYTVSSDNTINSNVFFSNIEPDEQGVSIAEGVIDIDSNFYLSPQFRYYGKIKVKGSDLGVSYDGQTKIITKCEELSVDWIQFKSLVDTSKIIIPLGEAFAGKVSGPIMNKDDMVKFYTSFLTDKKSESDEDITPSDGFLSYNKEKGLFEIGAKEKLLDNKAQGNYISFDNENCSFNSIGQLQFMKDKDQFQMDIVGEMGYDKLKDTALSIKASMRVEFPFNYAAIKQMSDEINNTQVQQLMDINKSNFDLYLNNQVGEKGKKVVSELYTNGRINKLPKELMSTLTLFDLKFYWDEDNQSFMAKGFANIATLGANQVFKRCKIYVQIQKRRTGDRMGIMIEYKPQSFYYFSYKNGEVQTYSTDKKYNEIIELTPAKDTKVKGSKGQEDFYFGLSSKSKPLLFLRNFESGAEGFDDDDEDDEEDNEDEMEVEDDEDDEDDDEDEEDD